MRRRFVNIPGIRKILPITTDMDVDYYDTYAYTGITISNIVADTDGFYSWMSEVESELGPLDATHGTSGVYNSYARADYVFHVDGIHHTGITYSSSDGFYLDDRQNFFTTSPGPSSLGPVISQPPNDDYTFDYELYSGTTSEISYAFRIKPISGLQKSSDAVYIGRGGDFYFSIDGSDFDSSVGLVENLHNTNPTTYYYSSSGITYDDWNDVIFTKNNSDLWKIYINGDYAGSFTTTETWNNQSNLIGTNEPESMVGYYRRYRLWHRLLTSNEISNPWA